METFLNIAIPFLLLCIVIVFLRSPLEIIRNLLKGIGHAFLGPLSPVFRMITNAIKESRFQKKEKDNIDHMVGDKENQQLLYITPSEFNHYIIINGLYPKSVINRDLSRAISYFEELKDSTFQFRTSENVTIIQLCGIDSIYYLVYLLQYFGDDYGIENTYCYMDASMLSLFFYQNPDNNLDVIGETNQRETFTFSSHTQTAEQNFLVKGNYTLRPKLNTDFFDALIQT